MIGDKRRSDSGIQAASRDEERIVGSNDTFPARTDPAEQRSCYLRYFYRDWHPTFLGRIWSRAYAWLAGLGVAPDLLVSLEVRDKVTGRLDSTVLVVVRYKEDRYLVSMLGNESDWVLNLRAADGLAFIRSGNRLRVRLREIAPSERAPILKAWSQVATSGRQHLPVTPDAPVEDFAAIASDYPVFRIDPADQGVGAGTSAFADTGEAKTIGPAHRL